MARQTCWRITTSRRSDKNESVASSSRDARAAPHDDLGADGDKRRAGLAAQGFNELRAIHSAHVAIERAGTRLPDLPARVLDAIFDRAAVALHRIAPVMLGDELGFRAINQRTGRAQGFGAQGVPAFPGSPAVFDHAAPGR